MWEITRTYRFSAAHSLPHLPEGHPCRNVHGHNYRLDVVCRGTLDDRGFVVDFAEMDAAVKPLLDRLDHSDLNETLDAPTTSAEHLAQWFYTRIKGVPVSRIDLWETDRNKASFPAP